MYKIAVLGDRDSVLGFKALGLDTFFVESADEARHTLHQLAKETYAIIYITEQLAADIPADIARYKTTVTPGGDFDPRQDGEPRPWGPGSSECCGAGRGRGYRLTARKQKSRRGRAPLIWVCSLVRHDKQTQTPSCRCKRRGTAGTFAEFVEIPQSL